jgi:DNA-binding NtrC family response regulator
VLPEHFAVEKMTATVSTPISDAPIPRSMGTRSDRESHGHGSQHDTLPPDGDDEDTEATDAVSLGERLRRQVQEVERQHIIDALTRCGGNQTRAARELGISRRTLISRLEAYNIPRPLKDRRID